MRRQMPIGPRGEAVTPLHEHPAIAEAKRVLEVEAAAILGLIERLDGTFIDVVELLNASGGRVVTMGVGKSGIICQKISATMASTGTPSFFLHPTEARHRPGHLQLR
jgi:arabinose-5-phosphate isomerase